VRPITLILLVGFVLLNWEASGGIVSVSSRSLHLRVRTPCRLRNVNGLAISIENATPGGQNLEKFFLGPNYSGRISH